MQTALRRMSDSLYKEVFIMAELSLKNADLSVKISTRGAEIRSVTDNATGREYMWQADPAFWGWTSPVLFPIVGNVAGAIKTNLLGNSKPVAKVDLLKFLSTVLNV